MRDSIPLTEYFELNLVQKAINTLMYKMKAAR